jgi:hypothetical protein
MLVFQFKEKPSAQWYTPVVPAFQRLRQGDLRFQVRLGYLLKSCLKKPRAAEVVLWKSSCLACAKPWV